MQKTFLSTTDPKCINDPYGFTVDETCSSYYTCHYGFQFFYKTCENGTYYNGRTGKCQSRAPAGCIENICHKKADGWHVENDQCLSSYRCMNQTKVDTITCPSGAYFDIAAKSCVKTVPAACQSKSTSIASELQKHCPTYSGSSELLQNVAYCRV